MSSKREKLIEQTLKNQTEILQAQLTRRDLLKYGLITSGGLLIAKSGLSLRAIAASGNCGLSFDPLAACVSPMTTPFKDDLRIPALAQSVGDIELNKAPDGPAGTVWNASKPVQLHDPQWRLHKGCNLLAGRNPAKAFQATCYRQYLQESKWKWHSEMGNDTAWVFDAQFPGPTFIARHKEPVMIRRFNCLDEQYALGTKSIPGGFGSPWPSTHLHNFHSADQSDGGPWDLRRTAGNFSPGKNLVNNSVESAQTDPSGALTFGMFGPGDYHDYHYTMAWAGYTDPKFDSWGDRNEAMNTLWYHDHCRDFTTQNVYKGMAGQFWIFDDRDTGDETTGLRFPSGYGKFDIPLVLSDRMFNPGGESVFPVFNLDGVLGDKYTVNGVVQPKFAVKPRRYRFRVLAIGPSRIYRLAIVKGNRDGTNLSIPLPDSLCMITNQGNLIPNPVVADRFNICPAERFDVLVDFNVLKRSLNPNEALFLVNLMEQTDGRTPTYKDMRVPGLMLRFDVDNDTSATTADKSFNYFTNVNGNKTVVGATGVRAWTNTAFTLCTLPQRSGSNNQLPTEAQLVAQGVKVNTLRFDRSNGNWTVNGRIYNDAPFNNDPKIIPPNVLPQKNGDPQIWVIKANGNWTHPVHVHFEEGQVISYNGVAAATIASRGPFDDKGRLFTGRRDVYCVGPNDEIRVLIRFRDFTGRYPMHCHNVVHEDHAMMMRFDI